METIGKVAQGFRVSQKQAFVRVFTRQKVHQQFVQVIGAK